MELTQLLAAWEAAPEHDESTALTQPAPKYDPFTLSEVVQYLPMEYWALLTGSDRERAYKGRGMCARPLTPAGTRIAAEMDHAHLILMTTAEESFRQPQAA